MKEDRLALQKAVDSGDTDLGTWLRFQREDTTAHDMFIQSIMCCYSYTTACP